MEGPSLFLAKQQLKPFKGKKILTVGGNTKIGKERLHDQVVKNIFSWGKHLIFQFKDFGFRVHFLLYGTFEARVNGEWVTGDYRRAQVPRLTLTFENGEINMYNCSIKYIESKAIVHEYNFAVDIMSPQWDPALAYTKVRKAKQEEVSDVLLDQEIFAGVGNIIKNETLSIEYLNPMTPIDDIAPRKIKSLISTTHDFSHQFYRWRKKFMLKQNLKIHRKSSCPHCGNKVTRQKTGKRNRWAFYCERCQPILT